MKNITDLDDWLLRQVFEPIAWRIEERTNINNYGISRLVLILLPIGTYASTAIRDGFPDWLAVTFSLIFVFLAYFNSMMLEHLQGGKFSNPARELLSQIAARCASSVLLVFHFGFHPYMSSRWILGLSVAGAWLHYFFLACNGMPPEFRERNKEFAHSLV